MKKRTLLISFLLISIFLFNVNIRFSRAIETSITASSDSDNDGIDDNFEDLNFE